MKNFNTIYEEICKQAQESNIEETRKSYIKRKNKILIIFLILIAISVFLLLQLKISIFIPFIIILLLIICAIIIGAKGSTYSKDYKEKIIQPLIKNYDKNLNYDQIRSINSTLYRQAEFEGYDNYYANDYIYGKLDGIIPIELGDVRTEDEHTDSDGNTTTYTVFRGLFSAIQLPTNLNATIKIRTDKGKLGKLFQKKQNVQMDSSEFEKYFDIFATDKILTMRILTSDIMNYMINFTTQNKIKFEATIKNSSVYLRIHCADMFEAAASKSSIDFDTLYKYYRFLDFICELNKMFFNTIKEKDI